MSTELARRPESAKMHAQLTSSCWARHLDVSFYRPMPHSRCPACQSKHVQWLPEVSKDAEVDYYRCGDCGHVWNVPKDRPDDPPHHVTPLPEKPEEPE
jgi:DNA-directed RNA polymerase subunit M/transcription elongation factor TFIIS